MIVVVRASGDELEKIIAENLNSVSYFSPVTVRKEEWTSPLERWSETGPHTCAID